MNHYSALFLAVGLIFFSGPANALLEDQQPQSLLEETQISLGENNELEGFARSISVHVESTYPGQNGFYREAGSYSCDFTSTFYEDEICACSSAGCELMQEESVCRPGSLEMSQVAGTGMNYGQTEERGLCQFGGELPLAVLREYYRVTSSFGRESALSTTGTVETGGDTARTAPTVTRRDHRNRPDTRNHRNDH